MMILSAADSSLLNKTGILKGTNPDNITFLFNNATYGVVSTNGSGSSPPPPTNQAPPTQDSYSIQSSNSPSTKSSSSSPPPSPPPSSPPPSSPPPTSSTTSQSGASPTNNAPPPPPSPAWAPPTPGHASSSSNQNASSSGEGQTQTRPSSDKTSPPSAPPIASNEAVIGGFIAGSVIMFLVALLLVVSWRRKRKSSLDSTTQNLKSDGSNEYGEVKGQNRGFSGQSGSNNYGISQQSSSVGSQRGSIMPAPGTRIAFSYEELMDITDSFSRQNMVGEGGFGCVYKGRLSDGRTVAIKQLKVGSGQGEREFQAEVDIISRVHHRHLVSLVGYCMAENQRLLIYEFVPNNTLQHHLHGKDMPVLEWDKRVKIALGAAKGIAYLHEDCHPKIIHRDIKSANILIDDAFEAQVADFGLAKLTNDANTHVSTRVMGTFGYLAPEYATSGKLTDRSDVFSFGVVLLELVTGRKPVDTTQPVGEESLVEWARPLLLDALDTGDFSQLIDPRLGKNYVESEMFRMIEAAAACIRHSAPKRPRMARVVRALDCEGEESLSNGVKYGQSVVYNSEQYSDDIRRFRWSALSSTGGDSSGEQSYTNNSKHSWNRLLNSSQKDSAEVTSATF